MQGKIGLEASTGTLEIPLEPEARLFRLDVGEHDQHQCVGVIEGFTLTIGTHRSCDLVLRDKTVSSRHCLVRCEGGRLWVEDLDSRNGVFVGGARVHRAQLVSGACFAVGHCTIVVHAGSSPELAPEPKTEPLPGMIGQSPAMMNVARQVRRLAPLSCPVLVRGATGTGKELVARALHGLSQRSHKPFVALNAGVLAKDLAAAELFGHDRGAFTGAHVRREGAFVCADGGTLFLDEVGELSADVQVKLLRALEGGEIRPIGSSVAARVNVRIVAATWAPLEQLVEQGLFREDLYHRLAVGTLKLPLLSDRRSDISALVHHFLAQFEKEVGVKRISSAALGCLIAQRWPGNVRQLKNMVWRAAVLSPTELIGTSEVESALRENTTAVLRLSKSSALALVDSCGGKVARAAKMCGVPRSTFRGWLRNRGRAL